MTMRPLLAIETSGKSLGVALRNESGVIFERNVIAGAIHGRALGPLIDEALKTHALQVSDLGAIAVSLGPGSWTGLRIGISLAKALAWGAGVPLAGVPSFEALARDAARKAPGAAVLTLRDARSEGCFIALFSETSETPRRWIEESVLAPDQAVAAADRLLAERPVPVALCGDAVCLERLAEAARQRGWTSLPECEHITGAAVAECGWRRWQAGAALTTAAEIHRLAPLYLRASDPELKRIRCG